MCAGLRLTINWLVCLNELEISAGGQREHRDSLVSTLEAFVHDPLITWRLLNTGDKRKARKGPEKTGAGGDKPIDPVGF